MNVAIFQSVATHRDTMHGLQVRKEQAPRKGLREVTQISDICADVFLSGAVLRIFPGRFLIIIS